MRNCSIFKPTYKDVIGLLGKTVKIHLEMSVLNGHFVKGNKETNTEFPGRPRIDYGSIGDGLYFIVTGAGRIPANPTDKTILKIDYIDSIAIGSPGYKIGDGKRSLPRPSRIDLYNR